MKHLHQLIVTSNAYRLASGSAQCSASRTSKSIPDNRLLWRMNTRRLEAELVRDCLLYVGGSLDLSLGGPDIDQELGESRGGGASISATPTKSRCNSWCCSTPPTSTNATVGQKASFRSKRWRSPTARLSLTQLPPLGWPAIRSDWH